MLAIAVGLLKHRPTSKAPWLFFGVGFLLFWLGDVYTYSYRWLIGRDNPRSRRSATPRTSSSTR